MTNTTKCTLCGTTNEVVDGTCLPCFRDQCPRCGKPGADSHYDRHGIYSGRACSECAVHLPGQGEMWDYVPDEPIEAEA